MGPRSVAFAMLKLLNAGPPFYSIATAPILRHFDPIIEAVIIDYASEWAISASQVQVHEGLLMPATFIRRILKANEIDYRTEEKKC